MPKVSRQRREEIARTRLLRVTATHGAATARTLENKISDAGPNPQRIDPHILTPVRNQLVKAGQLACPTRRGVLFYSDPQTPPDVVEARVAEQRRVYDALQAANMRIGQTLEIATYRALLETQPLFFGRIRNLEEHDDSRIYSKEEPPQHLGARSLRGDTRLDFIVQDRDAGAIGIECKNVREWLYPDRREIIDTAEKCLALDCIPVLIARRLPFVTFRLLNSCGFVFHQNYNQLMPNSIAAVVEQAKQKTNLGYHDLRVGNEPDKRLMKFFRTDFIPACVAARPKFNANRDLLERFVTRDMSYKEFSARIRRRERGTNEDHDWPDPDPRTLGLVEEEFQEIDPNDPDLYDEED